MVLDRIAQHNISTSALRFRLSSWHPVQIKYIGTQYYIFYVCCSGSRTPCNKQKYFLTQIKRKKWTNCTIVIWLFFVQVNITAYLHIIIRYVDIYLCLGRNKVYRNIEFGCVRQLFSPSKCILSIQYICIRHCQHNINALFKV